MAVDKRKQKQKQKKKKTNIALIAVLIFVFITVVATAFIYVDNSSVKETVYPDPTKYFYVEDYSRVLNERTERFIMDEAVELERKTKAQVVVVMAPGTGDDTLYDFSVKLANNWGIGDRELDNGVLIFFVTDPEDPHVRMEVGKGLEGALPDGKAGRILDDYAVGPRDEGLWNKAAGDTFIAAVKEVYGEYGLEAPDSLAAIEWEDENEATDGTFADAEFPEVRVKENEAPFLQQLLEAFLTYLVLLGFLAVIALIGLLGMLFGGGGGSGGGRGYSGGGHSGGGFSGGGGSFGGGGASR